MSKRAITSCVKRKGGTARSASAASADVSESKNSASVLPAVISAVVIFFRVIDPMDAAVAARRADRRDRRLPGIDCACGVVATALKDREILLILPILPLPNPPCVAFQRRPQRLLSVARSTHATGRLVVPSGRAYGAKTCEIGRGHV